MNRKLILLIVVGGLAYYLATFVVSMATGPLIHTGVLDPSYEATLEFWRPELREDPPDMAALMPMWIRNGLISAFVFAWLFSMMRPAFSGPGWKKGLKFGFIGATFGAMWCLGFYGVFDLPAKIWAWWALEGYAYWLVGGAALGWVGGKWAPED